MNRCHAETPAPKEHFAWYEKLIARTCLAGILLAAVMSIYPASPGVAIGYVVFVALGGLVVVYDALCVYCPYPFTYADCLFYPSWLAARFARLRAGPIPWTRKAASALVFAVIFAVPQYWLWGNWTAWAIFWGSTVLLAILVPMHLCARCCHYRCPLNRTPNA